MNKRKFILILTLIIIFSLAFSVVARAISNKNMGQEQNQKLGRGNSTSTEEQPDEGNSTSTIAQLDRGNSTSTAAQLNQGNSTSTAAHINQGQINAQAHRSVVANFVHSLLQVADRDGGIGEQVRIIAQQQNQSATSTADVIEKVQSRSKIKTFLFGSDYKNLGKLRSETVQTRNRLEQLNRLLENTQDESDKTELRNQIQNLEQEQTKIENFVQTQESKFNLFGWLLKLFNK